MLYVRLFAWKWRKAHWQCIVYKCILNANMAGIKFPPLIQRFFSCTIFSLSLKIWLNSRMSDFFIQKVARHSTKNYQWKRNKSRKYRIFFLRIIHWKMDWFIICIIGWKKTRSFLASNFLLSNCFRLRTAYWLYLVVGRMTEWTI